MLTTHTKHQKSNENANLRYTGTAIRRIILSGLKCIRSHGGKGEQSARAVVVERVKAELYEMMRNKEVKWDIVSR